MQDLATLETKLSCVSDSYAIASNGQSYIIKFFNKDARDILSFMREKIQKELYEAAQNQKGIQLSEIFVAEIGSNLQEQYEFLKEQFKTILEENLNFISEEPVELLIGSTDIYPREIGIYCRYKGHNIIWPDDTKF